MTESSRELQEIPRHLRKSAIGIEVCYTAPLAYLVGWVSGLALLFLEPKNTYIRFHAAQSVVVFGGLTVLSAVLGVLPFIGWILGAMVGLVAVGLWALLMYRAWEDSRTGEPLRLPVVADLADRLLALWTK